ncbi:hypothetical protein FQA39_LY18242 [Lamprigera yunnana]|nr:hypothetical protein FQA39_LY18242 [Lamprigera yunnana]
MAAAKVDKIKALRKSNLIANDKVCKGCKTTTKSSLTCVKCGTMYHFGCVKRIKKCCGLTLEIDELDTAEAETEVNNTSTGAIPKDKSHIAKLSPSKVANNDNNRSRGNHLRNEKAARITAKSNEDEFIIKTYKKRKNVIYGTNSAGSNELSAFIPKSHIHISNLNLNVSKEMVTNYINSKIPNINVSCEEQLVKSQLYRSYKAVNIAVKMFINVHIKTNPTNIT